MKKILSIVVLIPFVALAQINSNKQVEKMANLGELVPNKTIDTIPIKIINDLIVLKTKVNDTELNLVWDNGFSFSALDNSTSNKLQLNDFKDQESITVTDAVNKKINMDLKISDKIDLGAFTINKSPFLVVDLKTLFGPMANIHGILGATVTKKLNWKFNFDKNFVIVSQSPFAEEGITIPFGLNEYNTMFTSIELNGVKDGVEIDFGYNGDDINVTIAALELFKDTKKSTFQGISTMSVSGFSKPDVSYTIKDFEYKIGDTTVNHPFKLHLTSAERGARIGNKFFRHYNCIVNSANHTIILTPRTTSLEKSVEKTFGVNILKTEDKMIVSGIYTSLHIKEKYGLELGTEIVEINGKKSVDFKNNFELKDFQIHLLKQEKELTIKTRDGKTHRLMPQNRNYE
ncbi:retropepsin-like domain-containing protein [Polaribacter batillariae]|uniref:Retropepsin-like domain-containing protein n=1 Tax=Polaribacter batillariae TaxID=2808900 RepID=A0ABX7T013_9FLAO|nr:retropepsin-like aspartic protease [Polaribacter batillariae]QTD39096.1 retropepsin-like domain-containing protein [Polaribacter batillariae]